MFRYQFFLAVLWLTFHVFSEVHYTIGYQNYGDNDIATLWVTNTSSQSNPVTTLFTLGTTNDDSRALSLAQFGNLIYIVGYQAQKATLWVFDIKNQNETSIMIDKTVSSANSIVWSGIDKSFYIAGFSTDSSNQHFQIWKIDPQDVLKPSPLIDQKNFNFSYPSEANSIAIYNGIMFCAGIFDSSACLITWDIGNTTPNPLRISKSPNSSASSILVKDKQSLFLVGKCENQACIWTTNLNPTEFPTPVYLSNSASFATDLVVAGPYIYISGSNSTLPNIWRCDFLLSNTTSYPCTTSIYQQELSPGSQFNYIAASHKFPIYAGGITSYSLYFGNAFFFNPTYTKFTNSNQLTLFPDPVSLSMNMNPFPYPGPFSPFVIGEAYDMLINVSGPSSLLKHPPKTVNSQLGVL